MNRLRTRLVLIFLAATLAPLALTVWVTTTLLEESVELVAARELLETAPVLTPAQVADAGAEFLEVERPLIAARGSRFAARGSLVAGRGLSFGFVVHVVNRRSLVAQ